MSDTYSAEVPIGGTAPPPEPMADTPAPPDRSGEISKIASEQAAVQRDKIASTDASIAEITGIQNKMLPRINALASKVGVEAENLKPWNADAEMAKHRTDPIEAFGSLGSVFGILASTFTNQPMANALDASAAAMGAIKANDDQAYDRSYKAWQDNTKLAMDRHKIQRDAYQDAVSLMNVNMGAATTKMQLLAARFGDKQMQVLLDNGLSKEAIDLVNARDKLAFEMQQNYPKMMVENESMRDLLGDPRMKLPPGDPQRAAAIREHKDRWAGRTASADEMWISRWQAENPDGDSALFSKDYGTYRQAQSAVRSGTDAEIIAQLRADHEAQGLPPPTATEIATAVRAAKGAAGRFNTDEQIINALKAQHAAEGKPPPTAAEISKAIADKKPPAPPRFNTDQEIIATLRAEHEAAGKPAPTATEISAAIAAAKKGGSTRVPKPEEAEIIRKRDEKIASGMDPTQAYQEAVQEVRRAGSVPSPNRLDDLDSRLTRTRLLKKTMTNVEELLAKRNAIAGVGGSLTRPMETISNMLGSNASDRRQFERWVTEIKDWVPQVLNDRGARPLKAEAQDALTVAAGLRVGDTSVNTVRAYFELRKVVDEIEADLMRRRHGATGSAPAATSAPPAKKAWDMYPAVQ